MGRFIAGISCSRCWYRRNPGQRPDREIAAPFARCVYCNRKTNSGIYVRVELSKEDINGEDCG